MEEDGGSGMVVECGDFGGDVGANHGRSCSTGTMHIDPLQWNYVLVWKLNYFCLLSTNQIYIN